MSDARASRPSRPAAAAASRSSSRRTAGARHVCGRGAALTLVVCAPGYPGSTAEAQPAMDAFAAAAAAQAAGVEGAASCRPSTSRPRRPGSTAWRRPTPALALVPLPFCLQHRAALRLAPRARRSRRAARRRSRGRWSPPAGAVSAAAGARRASSSSRFAGYVPRFVRGPALGAWGELPPRRHDQPLGRVLSGAAARQRGRTRSRCCSTARRPRPCRRSPFAAKLQVVTRSAPLPVSVLCDRRRPRAGVEARSRSLKALPSLGGRRPGRRRSPACGSRASWPARPGGAGRARRPFERAESDDADAAAGRPRRRGWPAGACAPRCASRRRFDRRSAPAGGSAGATVPPAGGCRRAAREAEAAFARRPDLPVAGARELFLRGGARRRGPRAGAARRDARPRLADRARERRRAPRARWPPRPCSSASGAGGAPRRPPSAPTGWRSPSASRPASARPPPTTASR